MDKTDTVEFKADTKRIAQALERIADALESIIVKDKNGQGFVRVTQPGLR